MLNQIKKTSINILTAVLQKLHKNYEDLSPQAKATYDRWEKILTGESVTVDKLRDFLKGENENTLNLLLDRNTESGSAVDIRLKAELAYGRFIIGILESPQTSAKQLENYLRNLHSIK